MSGKILLQARKDAEKFVSSGGFEADIIISKGTDVLATKGLTTGHTMRFDNEGNAVISKSFHVNIPENSFKQANYPYKNNKGRIDLRDHKIQLSDEVGNITYWVINEVLPNATTGLIPCILGEDKAPA